MIFLKYALLIDLTKYHARGKPNTHKIKYLQNLARFILKLFRLVLKIRLKPLGTPNKYKEKSQRLM